MMRQNKDKLKFYSTKISIFKFFPKNLPMLRIPQSLDALRNIFAQLHCPQNGMLPGNQTRATMANHRNSPGRWHWKRPKSDQILGEYWIGRAKSLWAQNLA